MAQFLFLLPPNPRVYSEKSTEVIENSSPPLGISYLASVLEQKECEVRIIDMNLTGMNVEDIVPIIEKEQPQVVGISTGTPTFPNGVRIADLIKAVNPQTYIVFGGIHATSLPNEALMTPSIDIVCRGEGELVIADLYEALILSKKTLAEVPGISFKIDDQIIHNPPREYITNLDEIPFPARHLLSLSKYSQRGAMVTSRGCPARCIFCSCGAFAGRTIRTRSPENVIAEMRLMHETYGITQFQFHDDTFTMFPDRAIEVCKLLIKENKGWEFGCQSRVTQITQELADILYAAGCRAIQFGVESGNPYVLRSIRKGITLEKVEEAVKAVRKAGIPHITCGFMVAHPEDTKETIKDTVNFAKKLIGLGATSCPMSIFTPYPGTDIFNNPEKYGIKILSMDWEKYTFSRAHIETKNLTQREIHELYVEGLIQILEAQGNKPFQKTS
jgi:anaerobic magnesium-protoporphyrin IX monomethyl ester cyclase